MASQAGSDDPEVPYEDSESVSGDDDESFLNNPSKLEFPQLWRPRLWIVTLCLRWAGSTNTSAKHNQ